MKVVYLLLFMSLLAGCRLDGDKTVDRAKITFRTGDDTELFFKNIRQSYYDLEEKSAAKLNVFRYEDRSLAEDHPVINLAIIHNYMEDEAYILIEPNEIIADEVPLEVMRGDSAKSIELQNYSRREIIEFASQLYEAIKNGEYLSVQVQDSTFTLFPSSKEREAFRITMSDYYRLIRVF